jgi:hypothetical protein
VTPLGYQGSLLPQLLDTRKARRRLVSAALREWKRITAEPPGDTGQEQDPEEHS